uniref:SRCR domain-containing protein n=1 Tax=Alexandrium catenella TaxID=2925 RepID=A0A7S1SD52_ALECA
MAAAAGAEAAASPGGVGAGLAAASAGVDACGPSGSGALCALAAYQQRLEAAAATERHLRGAAPKANLSAKAKIPSVVTCAFAQDYSNLCGPSGFKPAVEAKGPDNFQCKMCYEECCVATIRLTSDGSCHSCATRSEGVLEVLHDGKWGTVCDRGFDAADATVACHQLGHARGGKPLPGASPPLHAHRKQKPIWLDNVSCTGQEPRLEDCRADKWGAGDCGHAADVYVECL